MHFMFCKHTCISYSFQSPENTQIKLTFTEFDIETAEGSTSCEDYLEIMHHSITAPGAR